MKILTEVFAAISGSATVIFVMIDTESTMM